MLKTIFYVKTQSFKTDRRVLKEIDLIRNSGGKVEVIYSSDCDATKDDFSFPTKRLRIIGGAAPANLIIRILGALQFSLMSCFYSLKSNKSIHWVCDPILFPLVLFLSTLHKKIVWDHHELPPKWVFKKNVVKKLLSLAYARSSTVIHANVERKKYLERILKVNAVGSIILKNIPSTSLSSCKLENDQFKSWISGRKFVFLQNTLNYERCGYEILKLILDTEFCIVHAGGNVNFEYIKSEGIDLDEYKDRVLLLGVVSLEEINFLLNACEFTPIFYRNTSPNQEFCEPNRVYQAMLNNTFIISGNNPTLVDILSDYDRCYIVNSDVISLNTSLVDMPLADNNESVYSEFWEGYEPIIKRLISD